MPPCTSFDDFDDVPDAKSPLSIIAVRNPRDAASSATPAPVMPPPTTSTSNCSSASRSSAIGRSKPTLPGYRGHHLPPLERRDTDRLQEDPMADRFDVAGFRGALIHPGEAAYDEARTVFN